MQDSKNAKKSSQAAKQGMGTRTKVAIGVSAFLVLALAYYLYTPTPDFLDDKWQYKVLHAQIKLGVLKGGVLYFLGMADLMDAMGSALESTSFPDDPEARSHVIIETTTYDGIKVRTYRPKLTPPDKPLPAVVFMHGGGWVDINLALYDPINSYFSWKSNVMVVSVGFRGSPQFRYPAGLDDCYYVTRDILRNGNKYGIDSKRVAVMGEGSGGLYATVVAIKLRDDKIKPPLKSQILVYGSFELCTQALPSWVWRLSWDAYYKDIVVHMSYWLLNLSPSQKALWLSGKGLTPEAQAKCRKMVDYKLMPKEFISDDYVPFDHTADVVTDDVKELSKWLVDPVLNPLMSDNLGNLPHSLVISAQWDMWRDDSIIYAKRLEMAGNKVKWIHAADTFHAVITLYPKFRGGLRMMDNVVAYITETL